MVAFESPYKRPLLPVSPSFLRSLRNAYPCFLFPLISPNVPYSLASLHPAYVPMVSKYLESWMRMIGFTPTLTI